MAIALEEATSPSGLPVLLSEAKEHLKVGYESEDTLIQAYIGAATNYAESNTRRALMSRNFNYYLDRFPDSTFIEIPKPKLSAVSSVQYYDTADVLQTFAASKYGVDIISEPGRIRLVEGEVWPDTKIRKLNAVQISYTAGYSTRAEVPDGIKTAMMLMIGHWFENREAVVVGPTGLRVKEVPQSANWLLDQFRVMTFY